MAYFNKYVTSLYGRRFGLQRMTTAIAGITKAAEFLVGPEAVRMGTSTADTTSANLTAYGVSFLAASSAGSSQVYTIDPPIPGVTKTIVFGSTVGVAQYLKGANGEFFRSSQGSTMTVLASTGAAYSTIQLVPDSTGAWAVLGQCSSAFVKATTST